MWGGLFALGGAAMPVRGFHPDRKWDAQAKRSFTEERDAMERLAGSGAVTAFESSIEFKILSELIVEFRAKGLDEAADFLEGKPPKETWQHKVDLARDRARKLGPEKAAEELQDLLGRDPLGVRTYNALYRWDIRDMAQVLEKGLEEMRKIRMLGAKSIERIQEAIDKYGAAR